MKLCKPGEVLLTSLILYMALCGVCSANIGPMGPALNDMFIQGSVITMVKVNNAQDCAHKCADNYDCLAAIYHSSNVEGSQGYCDLKDESLQQVEKKGVISFDKLYPPSYGLIHFPETVIINGTILIKEGKEYVPTSEIPVAIYLVKGNCIYDNMNSGICPSDSYYMLDVLVADENGHFDYKYVDDSDPRIWGRVAIKTMLPSQDKNPPSVRKKWFESVTVDRILPFESDDTLSFDLSYLANGVPITVTAVWKFDQEQENLPFAKVPQQNELQTNIRPIENTGFAEHLLNEYYAENMPFIGGRFREITDGTTDASYFAYDITASNLFAPDGCFKYLTFSLTRDGNLWQYMKSDSSRSPVITNNINAGSSGNYSVNVESASSPASITDPLKSPGLIFTIKNKNPDECSNTPGTPIKESYNLLTYYFETDTSQIGRNNQPLAGEYLGYQKLTSQSITYLGKSGVSKNIASQIASRSTMDRAYADLMILGDCNRDSHIDISDFEIITKMSQGQLAPDAICDMNGDSNVNSQDVDLLGKRVGKDATKGDCYTDYRINQSDIEYLKVLLAKHKEVPANCDMNSDGKLTQEDLDLLQKLIPVKIIEPEDAGRQASSIGRNQSGSFIPEEQGNVLPREKEMILKTNNLNGADQARPFSLFDMFVSLPRTLMSVVYGNPAQVPEPQTAENVLSADTGQGSPSGSNDGTMKVVVLPESSASSAGNSGRANAAEGEVIVSDASTWMVQEHLSETQSFTPPLTLPPEVAISVPATSISNEPVIISPASIPCPAGNSRCSGICTNLMTDVSNCGSCNSTCPFENICVSGVCTPVCSSGYTSCNGACVSLLTDSGNCGSCGSASRDRPVKTASVSPG